MSEWPGLRPSLASRNRIGSHFSYGCRVFRLVQAESAASGQGQVCQQAPAHVSDRITLDVVSFQGLNCGCYVVTHEVDLMFAFVRRWVKCDFSGRQGEDEPSVARIHRGKAQHVSEKSSISLRIRTIDNHVC